MYVYVHVYALMLPYCFHSPPFLHTSTFLHPPLFTPYSHPQFSPLIHHPPPFPTPSAFTPYSHPQFSPLIPHPPPTCTCISSSLLSSINSPVGDQVRGDRINRQRSSSLSDKRSPGPEISDSRRRRSLSPDTDIAGKKSRKQVKPVMVVY